MRLRSIELALPDAARSAEFLVRVWGLAPGSVERSGNTHYLRGSGTFPYLVALTEAAERFVRFTTFICRSERVTAIAAAASERGLATRLTISTDPGGGEGVLVELTEGEILRFLSGTDDVSPLPGQRDMPVRLAHIVFNSIDAEATATLTEEVLGFRVSDRTKGMVFVRCNEKHHSTAFARAGFSSLNHIAFEMDDLEAVMRGIGRMRDQGFAPAWGPGRHGPGDNAFAYYITPFTPVIEYSTAVETVAEDHRAGAPDEWLWPEGRIDQWGVSDKDVAALRVCEKAFRFRREWEPMPLPAGSPVPAGSPSRQVSGA